MAASERRNVHANGITCGGETRHDTTVDTGRSLHDDDCVKAQVGKHYDEQWTVIRTEHMKVG